MFLSLEKITNIQGLVAAHTHTYIAYTRIGTHTLAIQLANFLFDINASLSVQNDNILNNIHKVEQVCGKSFGKTFLNIYTTCSMFIHLSFMYTVHAVYIPLRNRIMLCLCGSNLDVLHKDILHKNTFVRSYAQNFNSTSKTKSQRA